MNSIPFTVSKGQIIINPLSKSKFVEQYEGKSGHLEIDEPKRTSRQNRALHLYLTQVAEELDKNGHTVQDIVRQIKKAEIHPTQEILKSVVWKPLQEIIVGKKSTAELGKLEVDKVYEVMNKWLGEHFETHIPFPHYEEGEFEEATGYQHPT